MYTDSDLQNAALSSNQPPAPLDKSEFPFSFNLGDKTCSVSAPFLDQIVLISPIGPSDVAQDAALSLADPEMHLKELMAVARGGLRSFDFGISYKKRSRIPQYVTGDAILGTPGSPVVIGLSTRPDESKSTYRLRLEFNPNSLGSVGLRQLEEAFDDLFINKAASASLPIISFDKLLARTNRSRMDVAVDIVGVPVGDLIVRHNKPGKWSFYSSEDGAHETVTKWTAPRVAKPRPRLRVYDKRQEQLDRGLEPRFGAIPHTRVELRIYGTGRAPLIRLPQLSNPFRGLSLGYTPLAGGGETPLWRLFVAACSSIGKTAAHDLLRQQVSPAIADPRRPRRHCALSPAGNSKITSHVRRPSHQRSAESQRR